MRHLVSFFSRTKAFQPQEAKPKTTSSKHSLFELLVHGQDGGVAHKGEGQDGNSVDSLRGSKILCWNLVL